MVLPVIVPRFLPDEYESFVLRFADDLDFPKTYTEWLESYTKKIREHTARGRAFKEAILNYKYFVIYGRQVGQEPSDITLGAFATTLAREND